MSGNFSGDKNSPGGERFEGQIPRFRAIEAGEKIDGPCGGEALARRAEAGDRGVSVRGASDELGVGSALRDALSLSKKIVEVPDARAPTAPSRSSRARRCA